MDLCIQLMDYMIDLTRQPPYASRTIVLGIFSPDQYHPYKNEYFVEKRFCMEITRI